MKNVKKALVWILLSTLLASILPGCSSTPKSTKSEVPSQSPATIGGLTEIKLPIVDKPLTLSYWRILGKAANVVKDFNEIKAFQEMEKRTGIHINFIHPPAGQEAEQLNLILASNELPDMILTNWGNIAGGANKYILSGSILDLTKIIDENSPNLKALYAKNPDWKKLVITDEGKQYMFPMFREKVENLIQNGFIIREDWLNKLGLKEPETMDDWYNVLKAFKTRDPNGNGKQDEIPFAQEQGFGGFTRFVYAWGMDNGFYNNNGKVAFSYVQPAYKEYLTVMNQWYKEGLIDPDYPLVDRKVFDSKMTSDIVGSCYGGIAGGFLGLYLTNMKNSGNTTFSLVGINPPKAPNGKRYGWRDNYANGNGTAITTKCKNVKEAAKWLDYCYSEEGNKLINFGPEGGAYNMVNGKPQWTDNVLKSPKKLSFDYAVAEYGLAADGASYIQTYLYPEQYSTASPQQKTTMERWSTTDPGHMLPPISPSAEESKKYASIMNEINTYVKEMRDKFVMGKEPLSNFDKYIENVNKMGIDEAVKINQAAFDRYNGRK